jgi:Flp pilus assembly protein TadG
VGRLFRRGDAADAGALSLGYIIVFPVFMLAIMTIIQASFWYLARQTALAAARQGADAARTQHARPGAGAGAALSFARSAGSGYLLQPSASDLGSTTQTIQIQVTGQVVSLIPGVNWTVSQVVQAPVEQFTTP